ncbi:hypothetical protein [Streptomyces sp. NPDC004533]|uniref:hypothetical protein n=1 Tax=Streptomyces sp. NPDC004533 TaxID=3154278 RepID=UPI0033A6AF51
MTGGTRTYQVFYTEQAATVRDRLDDRQRAAFDKGIAVLARDPFLPASRAITISGAIEIRVCWPGGLAGG